MTLRINRKKWVKVQHSDIQMCSMLGLVVYWQQNLGKLKLPISIASKLSDTENEYHKVVLFCRMDRNY